MRDTQQNNNIQPGCKGHDVDELSYKCSTNIVNSLQPLPKQMHSLISCLERQYRETLIHYFALQRERVLASLGYTHGFPRSF